MRNRHRKRRRDRVSINAYSCWSRLPGRGTCPCHRHSSGLAMLQFKECREGGDAGYHNVDAAHVVGTSPPRPMAVLSFLKPLPRVAAMPTVSSAHLPSAKSKRPRSPCCRSSPSLRDVRRHDTVYANGIVTLTNDTNGNARYRANARDARPAIGTEFASLRLFARGLERRRDSNSIVRAFASMLVVPALWNRGQ